MKIEVSNGELIDKLTILRIKEALIKDPVKLTNVKAELRELEIAAESILPSIQPEYEFLLKINRELWVIEDKIREMERHKDFGPLFIETARQVYLKNDERFEVKTRINRLTGSSLSEEKSYEPY